MDSPRPGPPWTDAAGLTDLRTIVEETVAELRSIAQGLRPSILDDLGLVASINQILGRPASGIGSRPRSASPGPSGACPRRRVAALPHRPGGDLEHRTPCICPAGGRRPELRGAGLACWSKTTVSGFDVADSAQSASRVTRAPGMTERAQPDRIPDRDPFGRRAGTTIDVWVPSHGFSTRDEQSAVDLMNRNDPDNGKHEDKVRPSQSSQDRQLSPNRNQKDVSISSIHGILTTWNR